MKQYFWMIAIVAFVGLFFAGSKANAQGRGHYDHHHNRGHYHHSHYRHHPPRGHYHHHSGATVRVNVPVPRPPRIIVRP